MADGVVLIKDPPNLAMKNRSNHGLNTGMEVISPSALESTGRI
jgi:hypothetical protein